MFTNHCFYRRSAFFTIEDVRVTSNPDFRLQSLCGKSGFASVIIPYNGEEPTVESYVPF